MLKFIGASTEEKFQSKIYLVLDLTVLVIKIVIIMRFAIEIQTVSFTKYCRDYLGEVENTYFYLG